MKTINCPLCDFASAEECSYEDTIQRDGKKVLVRDLRHFACPNCKSAFVNDEQSRHNLRATQVAFKEEPKFLRPEEIRTWRDHLGITQREVSRLLGGGLNAISKYENSEVVQSEAMDNLLWLVMRYPGLLVDLAERRKYSLPETVATKCGHVLQSVFASTWTSTLIYPSESCTVSMDVTPPNWWKAAGAVFVDGSWSRRGLSYATTQSLFAANDQEFVFAQLA